MKHILILEDEQRNANRLIRLLKEIVPEARIEGPLASIEAAVEYLRKAPAPDLILADIRLSDGLSFEALKEAPATAPIIFTTAYDEYAVQAFKYNSFDYLLKPIDADELAAAIEKVEHNGHHTSEEHLRQLFETLQQGCCRYRERFLLPYRDGYTKPYRSRKSTISIRKTKSCVFNSKTARRRPFPSAWTSSNASSIPSAFSAPTANTSSVWIASAIWATTSAANSSCACTVIPTRKSSSARRKLSGSKSG